VKSRKVIDNALSLAATQAGGYAVQALTVFHLIEKLDLQKYGLVAFSQAFIMAFAMLLDLGVSVSAVNKISQKRTNHRYLQRIISSIFAVKTAAFLVGTGIVIATLAASTKYDSYEAIVLYSLGTVFVTAQTPNWYFYAVEDVRSFSVFYVLGRFIYASLVIVFVSDSTDYLKVPIFNGIGQMLPLLYSIKRLRQDVGRLFLSSSKRSVTYTIKLTRPFFVARIAQTLNTNGAILLMGAIYSPTAIAVYSLADQAYRALQTLVGAVVVSLYANLSADRNIVRAKRILTPITLAILITSIALYISAPALSAWVGTSETKLLSNVSQIFITIFFINSAGTLMGYPLYAVMGRLDIANKSLIYGSVTYITLLLAIYTSRNEKVTEFAYALLISETVILGHRLLNYGKKNSKRSSQLVEDK
jgi:PST family polysaccharide transporter